MTTITELPDPPTTADPLNFAIKADAFNAALPGFVNELNEFASNLSSLSTTSTSMSSVDIGTGTKNFTVEAGKSYFTGMSLRPAYDATNYMNGEVISYSGTSLSVNVTSFKGAGTYDEWVLTASQDSQISTNQIIDDAVTLSKIADAAITSIQSGVTVSDKIQPINASVSSNALTLTLNATVLDFRSATLGSGTVITRTVSSPISLIISSGSTLGTINAVQSRLAVLAIDNAGTVELAVVNIAGGVNLDETGVISTTAEGGAGGADSVNVVYSNTARTNVSYRLIGFVESTQATAGAWVTAPSKIQGGGGQSLLPAFLSSRQTSGLATGISPTNGTTGSISFGVVFPSIPKVFTQPQNASSVGNFMVISSVTTTGFNYIMENNGNTGNSTSFAWFATI